jgi:hypothetical protein
VLVVEPVTLDAPDPRIQRREQLRGLLASHRRWRLRFAALSILSLGGLALVGRASPENARLLLKASLGSAAFFLVNALTSGWKSRVLAERLSALEQTEHTEPP